MGSWLQYFLSFFSMKTMHIQPSENLSSSVLVKLQGQLPTSQLVINALLDEFANIDDIYEFYKPTIKSAVQ